MPEEQSLNFDIQVKLDILALPESSASVLYSLFDVFSSVGGMWSVLTGEKQTIAGFSVRIVSPQSGSFLCYGGVPVIPHAQCDDCGTSDVIIIPDLFLRPDFQPDENWATAIKWLLKQYELGATICTVCTGSVLLADTGLLEGKEATTHWSAAELIRSRYPSVKLNAGKILVPADENHRIVTSGGGASWVELTLYLIKRYFGYQEASRVAKIHLLGDRSDGQLPFAVMLRAKTHQDAVIEECQVWIAEHYDEPTPVRKMMEFSGLAERTFKRRFAQATGFKPVEYVQNMRVEEAKQLLETTQEAIEDISAQVGYEDPAYFRRLFKRKAGVSPVRYRIKFQAIRYLGESDCH